MDEDRIEGSATPRSCRCSSGRRPERPPRAGGVPRLLRAARRWRALRLLRRHRRPQLRALHRQRGPGRDRAARRELLPRGEVRRDPREVRRLPTTHPHPGRAARPRGSRAPGPRARDPPRQGSLGARRDPRRPQDLQPDHRRGAQGALPELRLRRVGHRPRRRRRDHRRDGASGSRRTSSTSRPCSDDIPIEDWQQCLLFRVLRAAAPYLSGDFVAANFDFYGRTLSGTPELRARWKRGVGLVEGGARRGRRSRVRRPALPAAVQGADGRAGRATCSRPTAARSPTSTG